VAWCTTAVATSVRGIIRHGLCVGGEVAMGVTREFFSNRHYSVGCSTIGYVCIDIDLYMEYGLCINYYHDSQRF